jgi:hypothetical protein
MARIKYSIIMLVSIITGRTIVNVFGSTYVVSGKIILKIR